MPGPSLGSGHTYNIPPESIRVTNPDLYNYLYMVHVRLFGAGQSANGDLDAVNINIKALNLHGATGTHKDMAQGASVPNAPTSAQGGDINTTIAQFNALLTSLRTAKIVAP